MVVIKILTPTGITITRTTKNEDDDRAHVQCNRFSHPPRSGFSITWLHIVKFCMIFAHVFMSLHFLQWWV